jgi:hypothetical protein
MQHRELPEDGVRPELGQRGPVVVDAHGAVEHQVHAVAQLTLFEHDLAGVELDRLQSRRQRGEDVILHLLEQVHASQSNRPTQNLGLGFGGGRHFQVMGMPLVAGAHAGPEREVGILENPGDPSLPGHPPVVLGAADPVDAVGAGEVLQDRVHPCPLVDGEEVLQELERIGAPVAVRAREALPRTQHVVGREERREQQEDPVLSPPDLLGERPHQR